MDAGEATPPSAVEYVRLPDRMPDEGATTAYDVKGRPDPAGRVVISTFGVQFVWARFVQPVKSGGSATMVFTNMPQLACVMDGAATEWDTAVNQPTIGEGVIELVAVERGVGSGRVTCRNTYGADLSIAVGIAAPIALARGTPQK